MAGGLDKLIIVKPQTISTNFKSLSRLFSHQENWQQLYLWQDSHFSANFCMCILQQNFDFTKKKKHISCQTRWLKFGSKFDTIWPSEIALDGKHTQKMCKHTREHTKDA